MADPSTPMRRVEARKLTASGLGLLRLVLSCLVALRCYFRFSFSPKGAKNINWYGV